MRNAVPVEHSKSGLTVVFSHGRAQTQRSRHTASPGEDANKRYYARLHEKLVHIFNKQMCEKPYFIHHVH
jgi:hypothetical protein